MNDQHQIEHTTHQYHTIQIEQNDQNIKQNTIRKRDKYTMSKHLKVKIWVDNGVRVGILTGKTTRKQILPESCTGTNDDDEFIIITKANNNIYIPLKAITGIERYTEPQAVDITTVAATGPQVSQDTKDNNIVKGA